MTGRTIEKNFISNFIDRIKFTIFAFKGFEKYSDILELDDGVKISFAKDTIVLPNDFHIHCEGDFRITSDQHVIIESGQAPEEREGYVYSIWHNSETDEKGRPIRLIEVLNKDNEEVKIPLEVKEGRIILPDGFSFIEEKAVGENI